MGFSKSYKKGQTYEHSKNKLLFLLLTTKESQSKAIFKIDIRAAQRSDVDRTSFWKRHKLCCFAIMFSNF